MAPAIIPASVLFERDILNFIFFAPGFRETFHCRYLLNSLKYLRTESLDLPALLPGSWPLL
jgi:hypothetical protein